MSRGEAKTQLLDARALAHLRWSKKIASFFGKPLDNLPKVCYT